MTKHLRVVLAQLNPLVGDITGNLEKHITAAKTARDELKADVIVFPELGLTGYPSEDLLLRKEFIDDANHALQQFIAEVEGIYAVVGHPQRSPQGLHNACSLIFNGEVLGWYAKQALPNYGVFDEYRYFSPDDAACVIPIKGIMTGLVICQDLWVPYPVKQAAVAGAQLILAPNASPFEIGKHDQRKSVLTKRIKHNHVAILYVNTVGGQDELVFDGGSFAMDSTGNVCQVASFFKEELLPIDITTNNSKLQIATAPVHIPPKNEKIYNALVLAVRDYIEKNHFPGVYVGVSGGIDSALTLAIAVDALGKERVHAVLMPSPYTAKISTEDAIALAKALDVDYQTISIKQVYQHFKTALEPAFLGKPADVTEENIQARCRAVILMALSNKFGHLVLTTGNRSELAVGYCTLYGDMAGGFAVLKDVPKTLVYELANYRNSIKPVIPESTIHRAPTAELAPNQKDEDSLPPYAILDKILFSYLNQEQSIDEIVAQGFEREMVVKVVNMIRKNEYKRKQSTIGPHINHKSFGKDWRYPNTSGFKG